MSERGVAHLEGSLHPTSFIPTYLLYEHGKQRNEPEHPAIYHGTRKHYHDVRVLRTRHFQFSKSRAGKAGAGCLNRIVVLLIYYFWLHFHAGKCQLMQGIFQKENADKARKYRLYRHLPTYEKIIRNLVSF